MTRDPHLSLVPDPPPGWACTAYGEQSLDVGAYCFASGDLYARVTARPGPAPAQHAHVREEVLVP